jgi:hypothetical protein
MSLIMFIKEKYKSLFLTSLFFLLSTFSLNSFSRSPAVLPVSGISIEELKEVKQEESVAFDFRKPATKQKKNKVEIISDSLENTIPKNIPIVTQSDLEEKTSENEMFHYLLFLASLPLFFYVFNYLRVSKLKQVRKSLPSKDLESKEIQEEDDHLDEAS